MQQWSSAGANRHIPSQPQRGCIPHWVKELKRVSILWLKEEGVAYGDFQWQAGYADFSVSRSKLDRVRNYIADQETHHRKMDFQDELRSLLRKHDVEWDERFVWD